MSIKIFKPIKRFWRGQTRRMKTALLLLLAAALILVGFGVYLLARPADGEDEASRTLFPGVDRADVSSVLCHTASGAEYTVKGAYYTVTDIHGDPQTYKRFYIIDGEGTSHEDLSLNASQFSSFVVGTGKNYVYSPVVSAPEAGVENYDALLAAYEDKKRELGFGEKSPYYELKTESGKTYRVYYGIKDVTGDGYYVMLSGEETVYSTKNAFVGDLLQEKGPESLIDPTVFFPAQNKYAYAYPKAFSLTDYERVTDIGGKKVGEGSYYSVGYTLLNEDGEELSGDLPLEEYTGVDPLTKAYRDAAIAFFKGKTLGECNEKFTFRYPDTQEVEESLRDKEVSIFVKSIDYVTVSDLRYTFKFLPTLDRDLSQKLTSYAFSAPAELTSYIPDANAVFDILEGTMKVTGKVVKLGCDDEALTKYGLYRHQILFRYPFGAVSASGSSASKDETEDALKEQEFFRDDKNFIDGHIYVSDVKDGKRYIGTLLYDLVIEVEADALAFVDESPFEMLDDYVFSAQITDIESFYMYWNFGEGKWLSEGYGFDVLVEEVDNGFGQLNEEITKLTATPAAGGTPIALDPDNYYQLYTKMVYTHYKGEHGLSDEALAALLADPEKCVLRMEQYLTDGTRNFWEFYPMSANRVLVRVKNGASASVGASFYIYGTDFADIANGYLHMMEGEPYDYEQTYDDP